MRATILVFSALLVGCGSSGDGAKPDPSASSNGGPSSSSGGTSSGGSSGGSGAGGEDAHRSGTRLKMRFIDGDDGSRQFLSWSDSARGGEECGFVTHADGKLRCLPLATSIVAGTLYGSAACDVNVRVGYTLRGAETPKYAFSADNGYRVFAVTGKHSGAVFGKSSGCTDVSTSWPTATYDLYDIGAEVSADSFVAGTKSNAP